ncbi:MAG: cyclic pyranopterin monophosphate synthase MoaC [Candidatus Brocadiia bacterium]
MAPDEFSHVDAGGKARMVDVSAKEPTRRRAAAEAVVWVGREVARAIAGGSVAKGPVMETARLAGIQAAKEAGRLIPLCHPLLLDHAEVDLELRGEEVHVRAQAAVTARTGGEMEALTAAAVAALTVYDMCKALSRDMEIRCLRLVEKAGGKSGHWSRRERQR